MVSMMFGACFMFINIDKHKHRLLSVLYFTKKKNDNIEEPTWRGCERIPEGSESRK